MLFGLVKDQENCFLRGMAKNYWLFKSEESCFSINDLAREKGQKSGWDGVRNYQARNLLRDNVKVGDLVFFHHSGAKPPGIAGVCKVTKGAHPDPTQFDPESQYYDPKATKAEPRWFQVEVTLETKFKEVVGLPLLKKTPGLEEMMVCQRGARLSIQPVTPAEWKIVMRLAK